MSDNKTLSKLLCWFGLHKYELVPYKIGKETASRYECERCHEPKQEKF